MRTIWLLLLFTLLLIGCANPETPQNIQTAQETQAIQDTLALVNGTLIDGTGGDSIPDAVLIIQGDKILSVGSKDDVEIPSGANVIDVKGAAILPGFINAHVHHAMFNEQNLRAWAQGGVTTVRDEAILSSPDIEELTKLRDEASHDPQYARLITAGYMMTVEGGYGILYVSSAEDARQKVFEELDAGVDLIKISMEDGYAGKSGLPKLTDEEIAAIVSAAHERGTRVSGHITQSKYLKILVDAGVDDIGHIPYDVAPHEVWQEMIAKNIYVTPTFTVYRNYRAPMYACVLNLENFVKAGGQVALGNDYGGGPGDFELGIPMYEIEQMSKAGMTPMQIIIASTKNAAHVSGIEDQVGTLEAGKTADVLVVSGNPLENLESLRNINMVIHYGSIIRDDNQQ